MRYEYSTSDDTQAITTQVVIPIRYKRVADCLNAMNSAPDPAKLIEAVDAVLEAWEKTYGNEAESISEFTAAVWNLRAARGQKDGCDAK